MPAAAGVAGRARGHAGGAADGAGAQRREPEAVGGGGGPGEGAPAARGDAAVHQGEGRPPMPCRDFLSLLRGELPMGQQYGLPLASSKSQAKTMHGCIEHVCTYLSDIYNNNNNNKCTIIFRI